MKLQKQKATNAKGLKKNLANSFTLIVLVAVSFTLSACGGGNDPALRPLYQGSDGIILSFPDSNSLTQYEAGRFTLSMRMLNDGTANVSRNNPGYAMVTFDPSVIEIMGADSSSTYGRSDEPPLPQPPLFPSAGSGSGGANIINQIVGGVTGTTATANTGVVKPGYAVLLFALRGRDINMPVGEVGYVEYTFDAKELSQNRQIATTPVSFQVCYSYTTTFISNICVERNLLQSGSVSVCQALPISAQPQGAPVAVRTITPRYTRTENNAVDARYEITIENLKGGIVVWPQSAAKPQPTGAASSIVFPKSSDVCQIESANRQDYNRLAVEAWVAGTKLDCAADGSGVATFNKRTATIICRLPAVGAGSTLPAAFQQGANYEAPFIMQLHYFYIDTKTFQVEVRR